MTPSTQREIKFRAWDPQVREMLYDGFVIHPDGLMPQRVHYPEPEVSEKLDEIIGGGSHGLLDYQDYWCERWEVMQYTGLRDKNGNEIYEGDIVRDDKGLSVIHFMTPQFVCVDENGKPWNLGGGTVHKDSHKLEVTEVIGNIYEHPHLLSHD